MVKKKIASVVGVGAALLASAFATAPTAQAATARNGVCESGEFCLYYNSDNAGSLVDMKNSRSNYGTGSGCVTYISKGNGRDQCVKNNAASVWNRTGRPVTVFYKSGYSGAIDAVPAGAKVNLRSALKNNNAGHVIGEAGNETMPHALYQSTGGHISAYFDGYLTTSGRHEGIDIAKGVGADVHSLTNGYVERVSEGYRGRSGLSTIAIYNYDLDKTIVYLHSNPRSFLAKGVYVHRGDVIADEDWRGVSSESAAHTHVEMRLHRHGYAAESVGDPDLTNPVPTSFWMARGYNPAFD